ncbi:MAG: HNH endonuclease [Actinomycetota bacterium]
MRARIHDGPTSIDNLILLCRRCHRRVHRSRWRIEVQADDPIHFTRRGRTYSSSPRAWRRE